jgi:hypothetical protein
MTCTDENWPSELGKDLQRWTVRQGEKAGCEDEDEDEEDGRRETMGFNDLPHLFPLPMERSIYSSP